MMKVDTVAIVRLTKDALDGWEKIHFVTLVAILRHLLEEDDEEHDDDDESNQQIWGDEHAEVAFLHGIELSRTEQSTLLGAGWVEASLDEVHGDIHANDTSARIEALCEIESARGSFFRTHRKNIRIATRFEERQSAGHDEIGNEETAVGTNHFRWKEKKGACGIESESHQHTSLVTVFTYEDSSRKRHAEIASIESQLHEGTFRDTHAENLGECLHHGVGDVVGKSPEGKTKGYENERNKIADTIFAD